jgi:hypothetical protein
MAKQSKIMISVVICLSLMSIAIPADSTRLKISTGLDVVPSTLVIDGQYCAWIQLNQDNTLTLMRYDAQSTRTIATVSNDVSGLSCSNGCLAWIESGNVKFFDGQSVRQLSSGQKECDSLQIADKCVVWYEGDYCNGYAIMVFNGQSVRQVSDSDGQVSNPQWNPLPISDGKIVWTDTIKTSVGGGGDYSISHRLFLFDGQSTRLIASSNQTLSDIAFSNGKIAWSEYDPLTRNDLVKYFDGNEIRQISVNSNQDGILSSVRDIQLDNGQVAWSEILSLNTGSCGTSGGFKDRIMLFNGQSTQHLTDNAIADQCFFSNGKVIWQESGLITNLFLWGGSSVMPLVTNIRRSYTGSPVIHFFDGHKIYLSKSSTALYHENTEIEFVDGYPEFQISIYQGYEDVSGAYQVYLVEPIQSGVELVLPKGDINSDGIVDLSDFSLLAESWLMKTELPPPDDYIAHWLMDDNAVNKTVADAGDNHLNGTTQQNTAVLSTVGKIGTALSFNGTTDWVDFGTNAALLPNAWTVCAWIKCTDTATPLLFSFGGNYPSIKLQNNSKAKSLIHLGQNNYRYFSASAWTSLKDGQWHHVAFSVPGKEQADVNQAIMYLDGVAVAVDATLATGSQTSKSHVYLGANPSVAGQRFGGAMDDVMLFNRVLSAMEINRIINRIP